jgi:hypothetical protein
LSLFQPREEAEQLTPKKNPALVAPRASAKPPTRNLTDILSGNEVEMPPPGSPSDRPRSPRKTSGEGAPRAGATKNYGPIRLFDDDDESVKSPEKAFKTHPTKFKHFEFGNGEGAMQSKISNNRAKHASQWNFDDFVTPEKPRNMKLRTHDVRTMTWSDDEVRQTAYTEYHSRLTSHRKPRNRLFNDQSCISRVPILKHTLTLRTNQMLTRAASPLDQCLSNAATWACTVTM